MKVIKVEAEGQLKMKDRGTPWYDVEGKCGEWLLDRLCYDNHIDAEAIANGGIKVKMTIEILDEDN